MINWPVHTEQVLMKPAEQNRGSPYIQTAMLNVFQLHCLAQHNIHSHSFMQLSPCKPMSSHPSQASEPYQQATRRCIKTCCPVRGFKKMPKVLGWNNCSSFTKQEKVSVSHRQIILSEPNDTIIILQRTMHIWPQVSVI